MPSETLLHRGPNQQGVFESRAVSLGAARLKIIDLHGGDQPIIDAPSGTVIAFNGEIYNHLELRAELESRGRRFHSHSDTETVLQAFLEWDTDCFARMRGMFAVALWTESNGRLVLARDRMGIKPLYFAQRGEDLYFGSELKAIFVHPEIDRSLSLDGLDCYLSLNYVPRPWTLVEGIEKLRARTLAGMARRRNPVGMLLAPATPPETAPGRSAVRARRIGPVAAAIRRRAPDLRRSAGNLVEWRRGFIHHAALRHSRPPRRPLQTFSISFHGRSFDETRYIREVAQQLRLPASRAGYERSSTICFRHHRRIRLLFRRAQRRCRRGSAVAALEIDQASRYRGAERGGRR